MKRLLSIKETASEFGPSVWYWRTRVWRGEIKSCGDRKILLDRKDIEALIQGRKG